MKIKKLLHYIAKYDSDEIIDYVIDALELEDIRNLSVERGILVIRRVLSYICSYSVTAKIIERVVKHEIRRGRLTQEYITTYSCIGCIEGQPNQLGHSCLYDEK